MSDGDTSLPLDPDDRPLNRGAIANIEVQIPERSSRMAESQHVWRIEHRRSTNCDAITDGRSDDGMVQREGFESNAADVDGYT